MSDVRSPVSRAEKGPWLRGLTSLVLVIWLLPASAQPQLTPHVGYVYPAGARQGSTVQVTFGGQFLEGVNNVVVTGNGIQASVVEYTRPMAQGEFNRLRDQLRELQDKRQAAFKARRRLEDGPPGSTNSWTGADEKTIQEIREKILRNPPNRQATPAIAENVTVRMVIAADAELDRREIRLGTPLGLSNPTKFCIGSIAEFSEPPAKAANPDLDRFLERLGRAPVKVSAPSEMKITQPGIVNGQIMPGGVNRYRFFARKGQQIVAVVNARELIPYLADAVPGWFQATLALYDAKGKELAYSDDYRFRPDPVLHCQIPKEGEYVIEIKDAIYRGREDFVYRITLGEQAFVTSIFPLGGKAGETTAVEIKGWNLPVDRLTETNNAPGVHSLYVRNEQHVSNQVPFAVDTLPECSDRETNHSEATAQPITLPIIVNGRIERSGAWDVFKFEGKAGEEIVVEVLARRLDSPLDSLLKLTDAVGHELALNDDHEDKATGLNTHHADSYLRATLPATGEYFIHLTDVQHHGGEEYAYRLRVSEPGPDFELRVVPSSINARAGISVPLTVYAIRKDGFSDEIRLVLKDAPAGFTLNGGRVPAGQDKTRITLTPPTDPTHAPANLTLEGRAEIGGRETVHTVVPADDMIQAFAYRHLVPAKELQVVVSGRPMFRQAKILDSGPIKIPIGGIARVRITTPGPYAAGRFDLELNDPPEGIKIQNVAAVDQGAEIVLRADASKIKTGMQGNLIVNVLTGKNPGAPGKKQSVQRRNVVGTLPAIPFEITSQ